DTASRRDCAHMYVTIPKTFIRYVGNSLHTTDFTRIDDWVNRIRDWLRSGLGELYFFIHMHDEAMSPELAVYLIDKLNDVCGLQLQRPKFINEIASTSLTRFKQFFPSCRIPAASHFLPHFPITF